MTRRGKLSLRFPISRDDKKGKLSLPYPNASFHPAMNTDSAWNEMLDEFRALGGVAENIRLGHGAFGRGLFPIDPAKPIEISIPENLLVSSSHVDIENGVFRVSSESAVGARERAF